MNEMQNEFYSNCFLEMLKAKLRNPSIKVMYLPAFLNEVPCPHWMWLDNDGEHDFHFKGKLPWYKWFWHKGHIRTVHRGCYKGCIDQMIEKKYYSRRGNVMDAVEFIIQRRRMFAKNCITKGITDFSTPPEEVVAEVEKWAEEHRPKTRQEKFLEQFPKAKLFADGILDLCPEDLEGTCQYKANTQDTGYHCDKCRKKYWLEEVE